MFSAVSVLALSGLASASIQSTPLAAAIRDLDAYIHRRDVSQDQGIDPCALLSEIYAAADPQHGKSVILQAPPSLGRACLMNVPLDTERDLALLDYLRPFVEFQSTLEFLTDPPETYLVPGVDVFGGFDEIERKLRAGEYATQYQVMTELRNIFAAAADNHFDYPFPLLNTFIFTRQGLNLAAVSADGIATPQIYHIDDVNAGNHRLLDYHPSHVSNIDGIPIVDFLHKESQMSTKNYQDPDAQWNTLFATVPRKAVDATSSLQISQFEIPDNHTINFHNGSSRVVLNGIVFPQPVNFTGLTSGKDFQDRFEIPAKKNDTELPATPGPTEGRVIPVRRVDAQNNSTPTCVSGYPEPITKHYENVISSYFLDGEGYEDTAVLSINSFASTTTDVRDSTVFIKNSSKVVTDFLEAAKSAGKEKLVIDMSANGGGVVLLAHQVYELLFPGATHDAFDRFRYNEALEVLTSINYEDWGKIASGTPELSVGPDGKPITDAHVYLGPYVVQGQKVTGPFKSDLTKAYDEAGNFLDGFDPNKTLSITEPLFKPENIIIVTDGTCASACTIFTGFLTRNFGVRTVALGGRPAHIPMQTMGGVRGTVYFDFPTLQGAQKKYAAQLNPTGLAAFAKAAAVLPSLEDSPIAGGTGASINGWNGYAKSDLEALPFHFQYEAANCKLFYSQKMLADVTEVWKRVADVAFAGARCVYGSTADEKGIISSARVPYSPAVRSTYSPLVGPGQVGQYEIVKREHSREANISV